MFKALTFLLFFLLVFSFFWLVQWYLYRRYRTWLHTAWPSVTARRWSRIGFWSMIVGNLLFFSKYLTSHFGIYEVYLVQALTVYPGAIFFAGVILAAFLVLSADATRILYKRLAQSELMRDQYRKMPAQIQYTVENARTDLGRRRFIRTAGASIITASVGLPALSAVKTVRDYEINRMPLFFDRLPSGLDGLRVAQISDIHSGIFMSEHHIHQIVEIVNGLHADVVTITGDFVDRSDAEIEPLYRSIRDLKSDYGIFGCLGNHDHFANGERVSAAMREAGINMLDNSNHTLEIDGDRLSLAGLDDVGGRYRNFARMDEAIDGLDPESFKIMLVHQPHMFDEAQKVGMDLTLSGHTHGGQIAINVMGIELNPAYLIHEYAKGLYEQGRHKLYVNSGVGMVGVPIRVVRPEITEFTLRQSV